MTKRAQPKPFTAKRTSYIDGRRIEMPPVTFQVVPKAKGGVSQKRRKSA